MLSPKNFSFASAFSPQGAFLTKTDEALQHMLESSPAPALLEALSPSPPQALLLMCPSWDKLLRGTNWLWFAHHCILAPGKGRHPAGGTCLSLLGAGCWGVVPALAPAAHGHGPVASMSPQEAIQLDGEILFSLLQKVSPVAHKHLSRQKIDPLLYMTEWFMCAFSRTLPWSSVLRVWDMFFCEGTGLGLGGAPLFSAAHRGPQGGLSLQRNPQKAPCT